MIILTSNLGAGQIERKMGFGMEQDGGGQDARATVEEAIRKPALARGAIRVIGATTGLGSNCRKIESKVEESAILSQEF